VRSPAWLFHVCGNYLWLYSSCGPWPHFQFLNLYTVCRTPWTGDQPVIRALSTHRTTQTRGKRTQTSMSRVGIEPTIPVFDRAKTVHALKARPHYSCSWYSLYTLRVNIRILTRRNLARNWSSVDEDLRAQIKARRVFRRAPARARVMWTHLRRRGHCDQHVEITRSKLC
jgi:hypothetical protein